MKHCHFFLLHRGLFIGCAVIFTHNKIIGHVYVQKCELQYHYHHPKVIVNGVSTICDFTSVKIDGLCNCINA